MLSLIWCVAVKIGALSTAWRHVGSVQKSEKSCASAALGRPKARITNDVRQGMEGEYLILQTEPERAWTGGWPCRKSLDRAGLWRATEQQDTESGMVFAWTTAGFHSQLRATPGSESGSLYNSCKKLQIVLLKLLDHNLLFCECSAFGSLAHHLHTFMSTHVWKILSYNFHLVWTPWGIDRGLLKTARRLRRNKRPIILLQKVGYPCRYS